MKLSQEEIVLNLFNFHKMVVSNIGYPVYQVDIKTSSELERLGINLKKRQNLCFTVYLTINGIASDSCYFIVNAEDKICFSYCLFTGYNYTNRPSMEALGIDYDYWRKKMGYRSNYEGLTLTDIFADLLPSGRTHWEHMRYIIGCDIDWDEKLFERKEKLLNIFEQAERYIRLLLNKFKKTI